MLHRHSPGNKQLLLSSFPAARQEEMRRKNWNLFTSKRLAHSVEKITPQYNISLFLAYIIMKVLLSKDTAVLCSDFTVTNSHYPFPAYSAGYVNVSGTGIEGNIVYGKSIIGCR